MWPIEHDDTGWLTCRKPLEQDELSCIELHGGWAGPVKALETFEGRIQRIDLRGAEDPGIDEEETLAAERLMQALNERAEDWFAGRPLIEGWNPPPAETLRAWLVQAGCDAAMDGEGHLRTILKRRGCDGQIKVYRQEGLLRFAMPLWQGRDSGTAMARLCAEANARCRLARIAHMEHDDRVRIEAQVDLSGLPWHEEPDRPMQALWREMIRMSTLSLDLALRRLGLELPLLAEGHHPELTRWIMNRTTPARGN